MAADGHICDELHPLAHLVTSGLAALRARIRAHAHDISLDIDLCIISRGPGSIADL